MPLQVMNSCLLQVLMCVYIYCDGRGVLSKLHAHHIAITTNSLRLGPTGSVEKLKLHDRMRLLSLPLQLWMSGLSYRDWRRHGYKKFIAAYTFTLWQAAIFT